MTFCRWHVLNDVRWYMIFENKSFGLFTCQIYYVYNNIKQREMGSQKVSRGFKKWWNGG